MIDLSALPSVSKGLKSEVLYLRVKVQGQSLKITSFIVNDGSVRLLDSNINKNHVHDSSSMSGIASRRII